MEVTARQAHWFRLRRSGLVDRFATPAATARRLVGVQAQLLPAAHLALWNRTSRCTLRGLVTARLEQRSLIRMWGQRNTLHLYDRDDWPLLHVGLERATGTLFERLARDGGLTERDLRPHTTRAARQLAAGSPLKYTDLSFPKLEQRIEHVRKTTRLEATINMGRGARWMAAHLVARQLARGGLACHGPDDGNESTFVHREAWLPDLAWTLPQPEAAGAELACRYFSAHGPGEAHDLAHYFGISLTQARAWIAAAGDRCCTVWVEDKPRWCCAGDLDALSITPPPASRWPVRLLYRFDPLLLATKDKTWLIDTELKRRVWIGAAHVNAVLLAGGRVAGTWRYDRKATGLCVTVEPFAPLSSAVARATRTQAKAIANFLELHLSDLEIAPN